MASNYRPKWVTVGANCYRVRWGRKANERLRMLDAFGVTSEHRLTIDVRDDLAPAVERTTVLHEVLHAVLGVAMPEMTTDEEETLVANLAPILFETLFREPNRDLFMYLATDG